MAKPRRSRRTLTTLLVLVLVSVTIISLDESGRTHGITSGVKSVATDVFSPLRSGVDAVLRPIGDFFAGAVHYGSLEQENQRLQTEIGRLRIQASESARARQELDQLNKLLAIDKLPSLQSLGLVTAETIAKGSSDFTASITIDKGRADGVAVTDPVVGAGGLVGRVIQASHDSSTVQLVTDGQSTVGVTFGPGPSYAVVQGQGPGRALKAQYIAPSTPVKVGQQMYTNGQAQASFPKGIPVARVLSVRTTVGSTQKSVKAAPTADLQTLAYVQVIQWSATP